jgi:hypothetical protein
MESIGLPELVLLFVPIVAIILVPYWRILSRTGLPAALSLLILIPGINLILLYYLAFAEWPVLSRKN